MRVFLQRTAGATYTCNDSLTLAFRKDYVEYIFKVNSGVHGVINLIPGRENQLLFADWGDFFRRITNHEDPRKLARMLEKPCPKVVDLMNTASGHALISIDGSNLGISRRVQLPLADDRHLVCLAGDPVLVKEADDLLDYCLDLYDEIYKKCPFPGWKKGLEELW